MIDKPPLTCKDKILTDFERSLLELQRDSDAEYYEDKIAKLEIVELKEEK